MFGAVMIILVLVAVGAYGFYWSWVQKREAARGHGAEVSLDGHATYECWVQESPPVEDINKRLERCINGAPDRFYSARKSEDIVLCVERFDRRPIMLPSAARRQHLQILGPTGCGKSMLAQTLVAQDLMNPGLSVFVLEPKGGDDALVYQMKHLADRLGRRTYLIDPSNSETFVVLPLSGDDLDEVAENNVSAFLMYLGDQAEQFYKNKQETALRMAVKAAKIVRGNEATYDDLLDILRYSPHGSSVRKEYIRAITDPRFSYLRRELEEYDYELANNPRAGHYYSGLIDYLKKLTSNQYLRNLLCVPPSRAGSRVINLCEVLDSAGVILVTTAVHTTKHLGYTVGRLYLSMLQSEVFYRMRLGERKCPVACYIDEVQNYASEAFAEVFEMGRSADFMVTVIHHNLEQLRQNSKRLEQSVFTNARQKVVFGGINAEDAERIARQIGQTYQLTFSYGYQHDWQNTGRREEGYGYIAQREELRWVVTPAEIMKLPGFDPEKGQPAQVLCLLNIDNRQSHIFGLVYPVDLKYMKPTEPRRGPAVVPTAVPEEADVFDEGEASCAAAAEAQEQSVGRLEYAGAQADKDGEGEKGLAPADAGKKDGEGLREDEKRTTLRGRHAGRIDDILSDVLLRTTRGEK